MGKPFFAGAALEGTHRTSLDFSLSSGPHGSLGVLDAMFYSLLLLDAAYLPCSRLTPLNAYQMS